MSAADTSANVSPEEVGLELERSGIRFVRRETELEYRAWQAELAVPFTRLGGLSSAASWIAVTLAGPLIAPTRWVQAVAPIWIIVMPLIAAVVTMPASPRWRRLTLPMTAAANAAAGLCILWLAQQLEMREIAIVGCVLNVVVALAVFRMPPVHAALSALTPVIATEAWIAHSWHEGSTTTVLWIAYTMALLAALQTGLLTVLLLDRSARSAFRQERIIEAQKLTIARERARSEALLKQELSHQVAERSRELGNVLARSDVTLDVRRLSPGERFDARYRILAALGAGGMGTVYEVERLTDGATLALKAVVGEVSGASAARFAREAEIGARIHHPNLVSIVDVGVSAGVPFLVMELVRGGSLESQRARFGDVPWALPILRHIAEGLAALHDAGVVHRDLKPANVLLASKGSATVAKISDFGISRFGALDDDAASIDPNAATVGPSSPRPSALTGTGMVMGTPLYMAPEAVRGGRNVDGPADVFALGIIAYEMLTGRAPFSVPPMMLAMAGQPIPAATPIDDARVPTPLRALVLECLSADPTKRPRVRKLLPELP